MPLPTEWAKPEDFATLFQYFWHRDFPMDKEHVGARRADWTIHIGVVVRDIGDLMGLYPRFEASRKDAVLRSKEGDEVAVEWEWENKLGNELEKLKNHQVLIIKPPGESGKLLKYAVLITYREEQGVIDLYNKVAQRWKDARWPLLLILIHSKESKETGARREFNAISMSLFYSVGQQQLRKDVPALPWKVEGSRWSVQAPK